jgi:hypothetical protein
MAKDKGDKPGKSGKSTKPDKSAKLGDGFAQPSEAPATGDGWNMTEEAEGRLILFTPLREQQVETTDYGPKPVIVADVVVIDEKKPGKSEAHAEVFVWGGYLRGALRGFIGERRVLGRLVRGTKKERGNFPWLLEDATAEEIEAAKAYLASVDPFDK